MSNLEQSEKEILVEEKKILSEIKKEEKEVKKLAGKLHLLVGVLAIVILAAAGIFVYLKISGSQVYIENSEIDAAKIDLAAPAGGTLDAVYVNEGDLVNADTVVAKVGNALVKSKVNGLIVSARTDIGKIVAPGEAVVSEIDPNDLRVVGRLEEDKGLKNVSVGMSAVFTVDAFGSKKYEGVVDEVSPTSRAGDVVFSISDKREEQEFNIKVRFDINAYPELKNGMSAKLWVNRE
jgi:multidrug resistance efflux pump